MLNTAWAVQRIRRVADADILDVAPHVVGRPGRRTARGRPIGVGAAAARAGAVVA